MGEINNSNTTKWWLGGRETGPFTHGRATLEAGWQFLIKWNVHLSQASGCIRGCFIPETWKRTLTQEVSMRMVIALLFVTAQLRNPRTFFTRWTVSQMVTRSHWGMSLSNWKEQAVGPHNKQDGSPGEESVWKNHFRISTSYGRFPFYHNFGIKLLDVWDDVVIKEPHERCSRWWQSLGCDSPWRLHERTFRIFRKDNNVCSTLTWVPVQSVPLCP